jgi:hypothetical protein
MLFGIGTGTSATWPNRRYLGRSSGVRLPQKLRTMSWPLLSSFTSRLQDHSNLPSRQIPYRRCGILGRNDRGFRAFMSVDGIFWSFWVHLGCIWGASARAAAGHRHVFALRHPSAGETVKLSLRRRAKDPTRAHAFQRLLQPRPVCAPPPLEPPAEPPHPNGNRDRSLDLGCQRAVLLACQA